MKNFFLWISFALLIVIHTLDMEFTRVYIGNEWEREVFYPMQTCIKHFGIYPAIWISRIIMYSLFLFYWLYHENKTLQKIMVLSTILYWAAMIQWLDTFGYYPYH